MSPRAALKSATFAILLLCISASEMGTTSKILKNDIWQELESYLEPRQSMKLKSTVHGLEKLKITGICDLYPNNSNMKMQLNFWNNEISWENAMLADHRMRHVERFSLAERGRDSSNRLFDDISRWNSDPVLDAEAKEFGKVLLLAMSQHVDVDARGVYGTTPLLEAARFGADKAILKLIERGANIEDTEEPLNRCRAIHFAARAGSESCVQALLENGANVDAEDERGQTALFVATICRRLEVLKVLLKFHANTQIRAYGKFLTKELATDDCREAIKAYEKLNN